jgi:hypothetical protein
MADADKANKRLIDKLVLEILEVPDHAPPPQEAVFQRSNAGRIIFSMFKPLQRVQNRRNDWTLTYGTDNPTHVAPVHLLSIS